MKASGRVRWWTLAVAVALVVGYGAGSVDAKKPDNDGSLSLTVFEVDSPGIDKDYTVEVKNNGVFAVLNSGERDEHRLLIEGGRGLVSNGTLSDGDSVRVVGGDKKHKHRGHVTILK